MGQSKKRGVFLSECVFWSFSAERFLRSGHGACITRFDFVVIDLDTVRRHQFDKFLQCPNLKIYGVSQSKKKRKKYSDYFDAVFCKSVSFKKIMRFINGVYVPHKNFNEFELSLLSFLKDGFSDSIIAKKQCLPTSTVKYYLRRLYEKLGVENRTQAAMVTIKNNI